MSARYRLVPEDPTPEMLKAAGDTPGVQEIDNLVRVYGTRNGRSGLSWAERGEEPPIVQAWRAMLAARPTFQRTGLPAGARAVCDANGRRWRVEGPGWTMQPEGTLTADQAEAICRATALALADPNVARTKPPEAGKLAHHAHGLELAGTVLKKLEKPGMADSCLKAAAYLRAMVEDIYAAREAKISVDVQTMRLSDGRADYYVRIVCGGREVTPYKFAQRYKAEYEAAHFAWIFGLRQDEPDILAYDETSHPSEPAPPASSGQDD